MKILFLTKGDHVDYQNDCLLIGLREMLGADVVDYNKQLHNYDTYDPVAASKLYGKGMTVTRVLPDIAVDRTDITSKIKNKYYDYIVYGHIWRFSGYLKEILSIYPKNKVIAIDGEDEVNIHPSYGSLLYFKREIDGMRHPNLFPIAFAMPTSKLNFNTPKTQDIAYITPLDRSTYIYNNEKDYYADYGRSRFGLTVKKAGWDCMRHYEILGNGCIPYFPDIERCPANTMAWFPKRLCASVLDLIRDKVPLEKIYDEYSEVFRNYTANQLTTIKLAEKFLDSINSAK